MEYQLVIQFPGDSLINYDEMVAIEDDLTAAIGNSAEVDGHDVGSGEMNIFILTRDPVRTFQQAKPVLGRRQSLQKVTAAYRLIGGNEFTVIWPEGATGKFSVA
jgi:hypothetical protein